MECKRLRILDLYRSLIVFMYRAYALLFLVISIDFFVSYVSCNGSLSIVVFGEHCYYFSLANAAIGSVTLDFLYYDFSLDCLESSKFYVDTQSSSRD